MSDNKSNRFMIPVYLNEKIVIDMLAIMEDGFSKVEQVSYAEYKEKSSGQKIEAAVSTSSTILSKLLRINVSGDLSHTGNKGMDEQVNKEKVHTNVSLFSKFRNFLVKEDILKLDFDVTTIRIGDFIEIEGELQKNPLINYMDIFIDIFRMADIFDDKTPVQLGNKTQVKNQKQQENEVIKQIKAFAAELKNTGTIDFILSGELGTVVLSAQEQYLENDNISEMLGGHFKILGKVIAICMDKDEHIDLLRKTPLAVLSEKMMEDFLGELKKNDMQQFKLPKLVTKIAGPAVIVIPIAIYA